MAETKPTGRYIQTVGRRKRAIAQVRLYANGSGKITVNERDFKEYFPTSILQMVIESPFTETGNDAKFDVTIKVLGGGISGQADAVRHGLSRALIEFNPDYRTTLKKIGFLTRDSRRKERKKPGLKSARRKPQFSKR